MGASQLRKLRDGCFSLYLGESNRQRLEKEKVKKRLLGKGALRRQEGLSAFRCLGRS